MTGLRALPVGLRTIIVLVVLNVVLFAVLSANSPAFLTGRNIESLLLRTSEMGMLAVGQTLVVVTGGLDLSVGAIMALAPVVTSKVYAAGAPFWLALCCGLGAAVLVGLVNAVLIARFRMQPIIVTLATMTITRSVVYGLLKGRTAVDFPDPFLDLVDATVAGLPLLFVTMLGLAALGAVLLNLTPFGRSVTATGANPATAHLAGIRVERVLMAVYILSALIAGIAGLTGTIRIQAATADAGLYAPLEVITAVLIGGTLITGGRGSILGGLLGVLSMFLLLNGFTLLGVNPFFQQVAMGLILIVVIGQDRFRGMVVLRAIRARRREGTQR